jgi:hypothetical protein
MTHLLTKGLVIAGILGMGVWALTPSGTTAPKPSRTNVKKPTPPAKLESRPITISATEIQDSGIRYKLSACRRIDSSLVCRLSIVNKNAQDISASLKTDGTRFIDRDGEEYLATGVQIGSTKSESEVENVLISDTPIKGVVTFDAPPANVATMAVLVINHSPGNNLKFRNVKIVK